MTLPTRIEIARDEIHARATAVRNTVRSTGLPGRRSLGEGGQPASDLIGHFRSLLIARFDAAHGGFGSVPKLPHPHALLFALSLAGDGDAELAHLAIDTLNRIRLLWDPAAGGFYRYSDNADWTQPGTGKTLEDNAALLHVYVEAAHRLPGAEWLEQAAAIVRWVRGTMADETEGGFFNAVSSKAIDRTMYVDRNAMMVGAFIRAAALFDDIWLRDFALKSLEAVVVPTYKPGDGVGARGRTQWTAMAVRGLLTDQHSRGLGADLGARGDRTAAVFDARGRSDPVRHPHHVGRIRGGLPRSRCGRRPGGAVRVELPCRMCSRPHRQC